jgi:signal transduction histidine kinase
MEILALYTAPDCLDTALSAGARHLAATVGGFALIFARGSDSSEPDGWAGFSCAGDATTAGSALDDFRKHVQPSEKPLRCSAPEEPARIWERAGGGVYGFPLRHDHQSRGVAIVGCPGDWPRMRNAEIESILRQIALVLDHHAVSMQREEDEEPSDELLRLSEQLLAQDVEMIRQEERMTQSESLKNCLIERMAHEMQTPLRRITEQLIGVVTGEHEALSETGRTQLREALDSSRGLNHILQNLLDLWRVRQSENGAEFEDVPLAAVVEEAVFNVHDELRPGVTLTKHLGALPVVRSDVVKLSQILFHLLDNAVKFTLEGSIDLEVCVENGELRCSVRDTGIGIGSDDIGQVFDDFFQVDPTKDSAQSGAGLGLAITSALVEQLGGSLAIDSAIGQGTRVDLTIPVTATETLSVPSGSVPARGRTDPTGA